MPLRICKGAESERMKLSWERGQNKTLGADISDLDMRDEGGVR